MNSLEIITDLRHQLAQRIAERGSVPPIAPIAASPWVAMSLLQKSVRRGREDLALRAGATLFLNDPNKLWRRVGGIAFEDIGLADIDTLRVVVAALGGKRVRAQISTEWAVASFVISQMARAHKCRTADDLLMASEAHPAYAHARQELAQLPTRALLEIATGPAQIIERALALWFAIGTDRRPSKHLPPRRGEPQAAFDYLCEAGFPHSIVEIAREGFKKTGEALAPLVALLSRETRDDTTIASDELPPEKLIGEVPSWCLDIFTREGRAAFVRFLHTDCQSARWIRAHVAPARRVEFLGGIVFRVDGGLLKDRMRWPLGDELQRQYEIESAGPECNDATEIIALVRYDIELLNAVRAELFGSARHAD
jgi:hypothetical protein